MPPDGAITSPVRVWTTRAPFCAAGAVASSQSTVSRARKLVPGGADSSTGVAPVSP